MLKAKRKKAAAKKAKAKNMKLFYSPIHGFIHKVLVVAHEAGVWDEIEFVPIYPMRDGYSVAAINPLHKVPTLALKDGTVLYGSQVIAEYLDARGKKKKLYPKNGPARWDALRRLALADTVFEVTVTMALEKGEVPMRESVFAWYWPKVVRALDQMEKDAARLKSFDVGQAATLHALSYLDRQLGKGLKPPVPVGYNWRDGRPKLTAWWNKALKRPSVTSHFNKDYVGPDTPEFAAAQVAEVLKAQGKTAASRDPQKVDYHYLG
ncbi:MAG: glutathione S-transferase [Rhodospirillaceae bacterium]|nr:glutathione S-transferase [Rhodospirillaceae bacterium]